MNWGAKNLTTVDKERIWKEYVARESDKRVVYDEYRQRVTEKTRDPDVKLSPRGKKFIAKEPYGIKMEVNPATGRLTPVLTERITKGAVGAAASYKSPIRSRGGGENTTTNTTTLATTALASPSGNTSTAASGSPLSGANNASASASGATSPIGEDRFRLPPLSPNSLQRAHQQVQRSSSTSSSSPLVAVSPSQQQQHQHQHIIYGKSSPCKGPNHHSYSSLQKQYLQNTFFTSKNGAEIAGGGLGMSSRRGGGDVSLNTTNNATAGNSTASAATHHNMTESGNFGSTGAGTPPTEVVALDRALKNLQFMSTANGEIGRGTIEMLHGVPVGGIRSPTAKNSPNATLSGGKGGAFTSGSGGGSAAAGVTPQTTAEGGANSASATIQHHNLNHPAVDFGSSASGALRSTYHTTATEPIELQPHYLPGSPRSYVVKDPAGAGLFEHGRKHCDITKSYQELALRR